MYVDAQVAMEANAVDRDLFMQICLNYVIKLLKLNLQLMRKNI